MPTGYTADIIDGISFETYAMNCARAFGACVTLRDEPGGGERIPDDFEPSSYHLTAADKARAELATLDAMTPADLERAADEAWHDTEASRLKALEGARKQRAACEAMLVQVEAWTPPTPGHAGLHAFMREQIEQSIAFDCCGSWYKNQAPPLTGAAWAAERRAALIYKVEHHDKEHAAEVARAAERTAWVQALRASLA